MPDRRANLPAHAQALLDLGSVIHALLREASEVHSQLNADDPRELDADDFAPTVRVLERIQRAVKAAMAEELAVAAHYATWVELGEALQRSANGLNKIKLKERPLSQHLMELDVASSEPGAAKRRWLYPHSPPEPPAQTP